jgi:2-polyprenyl-3-methyl-5-hydroxy-6-metoxy-1,4-benzoquinol methylase
MRPVSRLWIFSARTRQRLIDRSAPAREELVRRYAAGRSFADIGCMWSVHGRIAFEAEAAGATQVTGMDVMSPTPEFEREHERRHSRARFVRGDVHDPAAIDEVGPHQVVWCSGVLYHSPNPLLVLGRLRSITTEYLILATETIPEIPGLRQACVFFPGLGGSRRSPRRPPGQRRARNHQRVRPRAVV